MDFYAVSEQSGLHVFRVLHTGKRHSIDAMLKSGLRYEQITSQAIVEITRQRRSTSRVSALVEIGPKNEVLK